MDFKKFLESPDEIIIPTNKGTKKSITWYKNNPTTFGTIDNNIFTIDMSGNILANGKKISQELLEQLTKIYAFFNMKFKIEKSGNGNFAPMHSELAKMAMLYFAYKNINKKIKFDGSPFKKDKQKFSQQIDKFIKKLDLGIDSIKAKDTKDTKGNGIYDALATATNKINNESVIHEKALTKSSKELIKTVEGILKLDYGRIYFDINGRVWPSEKIISFWEQPSKKDIDDIFTKLNIENSQDYILDLPIDEEDGKVTWAQIKYNEYGNDDAKVVTYTQDSKPMHVASPMDPRKLYKKKNILLPSKIKNLKMPIAKYNFLKKKGLGDSVNPENILKNES